MLAVLEPWWPEPGSASRQGKEMGGWHSLARRVGAHRGGEDIHEGEGGWRRWEDASTCRCERVRNTEEQARRAGGVGSGRVGRPAVNTLEKLWLEPPALPLEGPGIGDTMMAAAHPAPRSRLKLLPPR